MKILDYQNVELNKSELLLEVLQRQTQHPLKCAQLPPSVTAEFEQGDNQVAIKAEYQPPSARQ